MFGKNKVAPAPQAEPSATEGPAAQAEPSATEAGWGENSGNQFSSEESSSSLDPNIPTPAQAPAELAEAEKEPYDWPGRQGAAPAEEAKAAEEAAEPADEGAPAGESPAKLAEAEEKGKPATEGAPAEEAKPGEEDTVWEKRDRERGPGSEGARERGSEGVYVGESAPITTCSLHRAALFSERNCVNVSVFVCACLSSTDICTQITR